MKHHPHVLQHCFFKSNHLLRITVIAVLYKDVLHWMNNKFLLTVVTPTQIADVLLMRMCPSFSSYN